VSSHYEVLGVDPQADTDTLRRAYLRAARASHPDTGGNVETFAAVASAWQVLSCPQARARYDAEVAGDGIDDDLGWGCETAYGEQVRPTGSGPWPAAPPPARPGPPPPRPRDDPPDLQDTLDQLAPPDPFRSVPLSLPLGAPAGRRRRRWNPRLVVLGCFLLAQLGRVTGVGARIGSLPPEVLGSMFVLAMWVLGLVARSQQRGRRGLGSVALWLSVGCTAFMGLVGAASDEVGYLPLQVLVVALVTGTWAWVCWRFARRRDAVREREHRADRLALAHSWNVLLDAARTPGSRIVQAAPAAGRDAMVEVKDALTGEWARLRLDRAMCGMWLVLHGATPLARAPAEAPRAWSQVLAEAGGRR
jgi:hypothetical protein